MPLPKCGANGISLSFLGNLYFTVIEKKGEFTLFFCCLKIIVYLIFFDSSNKDLNHLLFTQEIYRKGCEEDEYGIRELEKEYYYLFK